MEGKNLDVRTINDSEIIVADDVFSVLPAKISEASSDGAILVVFDKNLKDIATRVADGLRPLRRKLFICALDKTKVQSDVLPEYIRYIVAVGCGFVALKADALARRLNVGWSLVLTAPTTDTILQGKSPKQVFIDTNMMINCPKRCLAAGFGILYSRRLSEFEGAFAKKVLARDDTCFVPFEIKGEVSPVSLAMYLLEISAIKTYDDSADIVARVLYQKALADGKKPRLVGEYKFIASSYLLTLYSHLLASPAIDVMPPPDAVAAFDALEKIGCKNFCDASKRIDFFEINGYFRISYILSEYRTDLIEQLSSLDMRKYGRAWRRIYDDAGFSLKSAVTADDMRFATMLAGSVSDNLLGYAYATGALTRLA